MIMTKNEAIKRYAFFLAGVFVNSLGVAFVTLAGLGASPLSVIPYVMSLKFSLSLGQFTMIFNVLLVLLQILIMKKRFPKVQLLQIPAGILAGLFVDFSMNYLLFWVDPSLYAQKIFFILLGCAVTAMGVFMEVAADVVMLPGEGMTQAIRIKSGREFGVIKTVMDAAMCVLAVALAVILLSRIGVIREGTVLAAVLVGLISRLLIKFFDPIVQRTLRGGGRWQIG